MTSIDIALRLLFALTVTLAVYKAAQLARMSRNLPLPATQAWREQLERWLPTLAVIAVTAPFIGLSGTIVHITGALASIRSAGMDLKVISGPIAQALDATLWGLASAIAATAAHRWLSFKAQTLLERAHARARSNDA